MREELRAARCGWMMICAVLVTSGLARSETLVDFHDVTPGGWQPLTINGGLSAEARRHAVAPILDAWPSRSITLGGQFVDRGGSSLATVTVSAPSGAQLVSGDFNGDGTSEWGVFHQGLWWLDTNGNRRRDAQDRFLAWGRADDLAVAGDWDGDGKTDIGVFSPRSEVASRTIRRVAHRSDRLTISAPLYLVAGDFDGDGRDSPALFRGGVWWLDVHDLRQIASSEQRFQLGSLDARPVVGDLDGDGRDELGVFAAGRWQFDRNANRQFDAEEPSFTLGGVDDQPLLGAFDGDVEDRPGIVHGE